MTTELAQRKGRGQLRSSTIRPVILRSDVVRNSLVEQAGRVESASF